MRKLIGLAVGERHDRVRASSGWNIGRVAVAQFAPGPGSHGGRWQVWMATWTDVADAHLLTSFDAVMAEVEAGNLTLERAPDADFRCPILP